MLIGGGCKNIIVKSFKIGEEIFKFVFWRFKIIYDLIYINWVYLESILIDIIV